MAAPATLQEAWLGAQDGRLCPREQARAWALREVWREEGKGSYGLQSFVASKVKTNKDGKPIGKALTKQSIGEFFAKLDDGPEWYPGKTSGEARGPKRLLRGSKATAIVSAAKRLKSEGPEPTYANIIAACPAATLNPETEEPVDKKLVYTLFREACYDDGALVPWDHMARLSRVALTPDVMERRAAFAEYMLGLRHSDNWYHDHVVWCDLCNSLHRIFSIAWTHVASLLCCRRTRSMGPTCYFFNLLSS